jgi:hypothetical protein
MAQANGSSHDGALIATICFASCPRNQIAAVRTARLSEVTQVQHWTL